MTDIPDWDTVQDEIEPIAREYLENVRENFNPSVNEISEPGERNSTGEVVWDLTIDTDSDTFVISFKLVDSTEYEGELLGYNVSVDAVAEDGRILEEYTPHNYTEDVWTTDIDELKSRANNLPELTHNILE